MNQQQNPARKIKDTHRYYIQTMPGVEQIAWLEIKRRLPQAVFKEYLFAKDKNGIVVFDFPGASSELLALRTAEDVFLLALHEDKVPRGWDGLDAVADLFRESVALQQAVAVVARQRKLRGPLSYRVVTRKEGQHQYRRKDFEEALVKGLGRRRKENWYLVEEDADLEIWANLLGSVLLCGVRLSDRAMRHRDYKAIHLPASLRPSVAAAMVLLSEPHADDVFLDPMCGAGTILAERIMHGPYQAVLGGDILFDRARAGYQNMAALANPSLVCCWDALSLPLAAESVHKAVSNPPFGKQLGSRELIIKLYPGFLAELERVLKPGGRAVVLSSEYELIKEAVRQRGQLQITRGYSISVLGQWARIYIIDKLPTAPIPLTSSSE